MNEPMSGDPDSARQMASGFDLRCLPGGFHAAPYPTYRGFRSIPCTLQT